MHNLQEFMLSTKSNEYLIAIGFLIVFIFFWKFLNTPRYQPVRATVVKPFELIKGLFGHPSHTWAEVVQPNLVNVGMDKFTSSVFGSIEKMELPKKGDTIYQGGKAWRMKRGRRELIQVSPLTGRVVDINEEVIKNPNILKEKNPEKNWILKVAPTRLAREIRNLLTQEMLPLWNQMTKEHLVADLVPAEYPVLQEGGEIKPDLGDELTSEQWQRVAKEFFNTSVNI
jgi:glycine cleavage system H protein